MAVKKKEKTGETREEKGIPREFSLIGRIRKKESK